MKNAESCEQVRMRIGVGRSAKGRKSGGFVLGKFSEAEQQQFPTLLERPSSTALTSIVNI